MTEIRVHQDEKNVFMFDVGVLVTTSSGEIFSVYHNCFRQTPNHSLHNNEPPGQQL